MGCCTSCTKASCNLPRNIWGKTSTTSYASWIRKNITKIWCTVLYDVWLPDKASICLICAAGKGEERKGTGSGLLTFGDSWLASMDAYGCEAQLRFAVPFFRLLEMHMLQKLLSCVLRTHATKDPTSWGEQVQSTTTRWPLVKSQLQLIVIHIYLVGQYAEESFWHNWPLFQLSISQHRSGNTGHVW